MEKPFRSMTAGERDNYLRTTAAEALRHLQATKEHWRDFLAFSGRFYKYSFWDALMIYAQMPDATACGEIKHWNAIGRRVHKGRAGIPITNFRTDVRFVYDVTDTYGDEATVPQPWRLPAGYIELVAEALSQAYGTPLVTDQADKNIKWIIEQYTREHCLEYPTDLFYDTVKNRTEWLATVVDSVGFLVSVRCGLAPGLYAGELAFKFLKNLKREELISTGEICGQLGKQILTAIHNTITRQEKTRGKAEEDGQGKARGSYADGGRNSGHGIAGADRPGMGEYANRSLRGVVAGLHGGNIPAEIFGVKRAVPPVRDGAGGEPGSEGDEKIADRAVPAAAPPTAGGPGGDGAVRPGPQAVGKGSLVDGDGIPAKIAVKAAAAEAGGVRPPLPPVRDRKRDTLQHSNFRALERLAPELVSGEALYMRFTAGESFMPLSIDRLGKNRISIAHNYEQNGDLMADPDMTFVIDREAGALSARTYQQAGIGRYQTVEDENGNISNAGLAGQLDSFARQWFSNIRKQQFEKSLMRVLSQGEEIDVVFGPEGKVTEITGPDAAVDAYARKIGIEPPPYEDEAGAPSRSIRLTRIGDFYEAYGEDAQTLTELLNLSLTPRQGAAMCGFPDRLLDEYATRLKEVGYAFALTEVSAKGTAITPSASLMSETEGSGEKSEPQNFVSTDEAGVSGKTKYRRNVEAIKLLRAIEAEGRNAAAQEQETLSRYSGWGSLPQVFDPEPKPEWRREWAELKTLLTGKEYDLAAGSTLNAHYTPIEVVTMSTR